MIIIVSTLSNRGVVMKYENLNCIMEELKVIYKLHHQFMYQNCKQVTPEQGKLLFLIREQKMSQKELAKRLNITEATLSVRIKRLVESGYIEREINQKDKRIFSIVLSSKGKDFMKEIDDNIKQYKEKVCRGISYSDYETILKVIYKIQENIREELK